MSETSLSRPLCVSMCMQCMHATTIHKVTLFLPRVCSGRLPVLAAMLQTRVQ